MGRHTPSTSTPRSNRVCERTGRPVELELKSNAKEAAARLDKRERPPIGVLRAIDTEVGGSRFVGHVDQIPRQAQAPCSTESEVLVEAEPQVVCIRQMECA